MTARNRGGSLARVTPRGPHCKKNRKKLENNITPLPLLWSMEEVYLFLATFFLNDRIP